MDALGHQELTNLHQQVNNVDETSDNESNEIAITDRLTVTVSLSLSKLVQAIAACFQIIKRFLDTLTKNNSH